MEPPPRFTGGTNMEALIAIDPNARIINNAGTVAIINGFCVALVAPDFVEVTDNDGAPVLRAFTDDEVLVTMLRMGADPEPMTAEEEQALEEWGCPF